MSGLPFPCLKVLRVTSLRQLIPLLSEINDCKRLHRAGFSGSLADQWFRSAWAGLVAGEETALRVTAHVVANARLGGIDRKVLQHARLDAPEITAILQRSFDAVSTEINLELCAQLRQELPFDLPEGEVPEFAHQLCDQPRAGATRPGRPRMVLLPVESHGGHCLVVAVYAVLLAPYFKASPVIPFFAALAHHLHNAVMPDGGFTGEEMLGAHLEPVIRTFREEALAQLEEKLGDLLRNALAATASAATPEGKAFHAADVIDRVLQMKWYEGAANFHLGMALEDMELVHAGPVQAFHRDTLRDAGLW